MKKQHFNVVVMSLLCIGTFVLNSCGEENAPAPPTHAVVLKFKNPDYKNYILATYSEGSDSIVAARFNSCGEPVGRSKYSPYWDLPDNWLLVDWKWINFPYTAGLTLLTNQTWDKYPAETFPLPKWPVAEPHIFQPLDKILYVKASDLEKYHQKTYSYETIALMEGLFQCNNDSSRICEQSERADSIWSILYNDLSIVIKNGDINKLSN